MIRKRKILNWNWRWSAKKQKGKEKKLKCVKILVLASFDNVKEWIHTFSKGGRDHGMSKGCMSRCHWCKQEQIMAENLVFCHQKWGTPDRLRGANCKTSNSLVKITETKEQNRSLAPKPQSTTLKVITVNTIYFFYKKPRLTIEDFIKFPWWCMHNKIFGNPHL